MAKDVKYEDRIIAKAVYFRIIYCKKVAKKIHKFNIIDLNAIIIIINAVGLLKLFIATFRNVLNNSHASNIINVCILFLTA